MAFKTTIYFSIRVLHVWYPLQVEEIRSTVQKLETGISSMETEKKKIQGRIW